MTVPEWEARVSYMSSLLRCVAQEDVTQFSRVAQYLQDNYTKDEIETLTDEQIYNIYGGIVK